MLSGIRNVTKGWIATGLLSILGISFAVWGIKDGLNFSAPTDIASGQGVRVMAAEYKKAFDNAVDQAREQAKRPVTRQEAYDAGIGEDVLKNLIAQKSIDALARKAGYTASNTMVADAIRTEPAFRSQFTGAFDKQQYATMLARNGLTQPEFEQDLRDRMTRRQLATSMVMGIHTPQSMAKLMYAFGSERRVVSVAEINPDRVGAPPEPTDADLQTFYKENLASFKTPEFRNLTIVKARPEAFAARVDVPEDKVKALYDYRKPTLTTGEKRSFVQISTGANEAAATEAARRLAAGDDPQKIAADLKVQAVAFTAKTKGEVPDAAVREAVFALQKGQSTGPIKGQLSWAAARVADITAGSTPSYEAAHDELKTALAKEAAQDMLNDAVDKFDTARTGGKSLEEAATAAGLDVYKIDSVTAQGVRDQTGPVAGLADAPELLKAAFLAPLSEPTDFSPTPDGGYSLVRVDKITPPGTRTLAQVKPVLVLAWKARKVGEAMRAIGDAITKAVAGGQSFADAVAAQKIKMIAKSEMLDRGSAQNSGVPMLFAMAFGAQEKDVVVAPDARNQVLLVAQVERIRREDPALDPQGYSQAVSQVSQMLTNDFLLSLESSAKTGAKVKRNEKLVTQTLGVEAKAEDEKPK
jgi:peptidyl-prolyl cis-trans isomerase D